MTTEVEQLRVDLEMTLTKFEAAARRAQKVGAITATDIDKIYARMAKSVGTSADKAAKGLSGMMNVSRGGRFVLQNTAAQFGDIAVQMEQGTDAMRVMGQQMPQILGGFGALNGALGIVGPLLGTVAAVGFPIAAMLLAQGDSAKDAAPKVESFAKQLDKAEAALQRANEAAILASAGGLEDLKETYGEVTKEIVELVDALSAIEAANAAREIGGVIEAANVDRFGGDVSKIFEDRAKQIAELESEVSAYQAAVDTLENRKVKGLAFDPEELALLQKYLEKTRDELNALPPVPEALELTKGIAELNQLGEAAQAAASAGQWQTLADLLARMRDTSSDLGLEIGTGVVTELTEAEALARKAAKNFSDAETEASNVAVGASGIKTELSDANTEAAALVGNLQAAMGALANVASGILAAQRKARKIAQIKMETIGQPVERAGRIARAEFNEESGAAAYAAIRTGNTEALGKIGQVADEIEAAVRETTKAEEKLRAAEKTYAESIRQSRGGGGSKRGKRGGKGKTEKEFGPQDLMQSAERELIQMERRIEMLGKTDAQIAELTLKYRLLDQAKKEGLDLDQRSAETGETLRQVVERQAKALSEQAQAYEDAKSRQEALNQANLQFEDLVVNSFDNATESVQSFVQWLKRAALQYALFGKGPLSGLFGGGFGGLLGGLDTFDGGGFTGFGSRTGGVDGKGGFPAILHPNETVIDHTKRGASGGGRTQVVVHNHSGQQVVTKSTTLPGGGRREEVIVGDMMAGLMDAPGSRPNKSLRRRGVMHPLTRY